MNKLYPARRIAQGWLALGLITVALAMAIGVAHFGFGVEVVDKNTGEPASSAGIGVGTLFMGTVGAVFASVGVLLLRAAKRPRGS